jgi:hypothetical protein
LSAYFEFLAEIQEKNIHHAKIFVTYQHSGAWKLL